MPFEVIVLVVISLTSLFMTILKNWSPRKWLARSKQRLTQELVLIKPSNCQIVPASTVRGDAWTLQELQTALSQLNGYKSDSYAYNDIILKRVAKLDRTAIDDLTQLRYFDKIEKVKDCIAQNGRVVQSVVENILTKLYETNSKGPYALHVQNINDSLGYSLNSSNQLVQKRVVMTATATNGKVSEAVSHLCRDWSPGFEVERKPLVDYVVSRIRKISPSGSKVLVVVPGAGVGGLSYRIAQEFPQFQVDSIELSTLMYICNKYALDSKTDVIWHPFAANYSSQISATDQTRPMQLELSQVHNLPNLNVLWGDFCKCSPNEAAARYDSIIVCTCFFMDTAENIFSYLDSVESLRQYSTTSLHWINIGPLKYGSSPLVQLSADELQELRKLHGWRDLHEERLTDYTHGLNGYLTDYKSLYQGYYGLVKFHSQLSPQTSSNFSQL